MNFPEEWIKDRLSGLVKEELMRSEDQKFQTGERMAFGEGDFQLQARTYVFHYIRERLEKTDKHVTFAMDEIYVVWFTKALQNWRCMISTTLPDGMYYEVTYYGDTKIIYLVAYKKYANGVNKDLPGEKAVQMAEMSSAELAKFRAMLYIKAHRQDWDIQPAQLRHNDVQVRWISEIMQNWKAIVTTGLNYDLLFEVTYNGDKTETYLDVYKKWDQIRISLGEDSHG